VKKLKDIVFVSFGHKDVGSYPCHPGKDAAQHIIDIRDVIEDPKHILVDKDGTTKEVQDFILKNQRTSVWISFMQCLVLKWALEFEEGDKQQLIICFGCGGGIQRSVAVVEILSDFLEEARGDDFEITKKHWSLDKKKAQEE